MNAAVLLILYCMYRPERCDLAQRTPIVQDATAASYLDYATSTIHLYPNLSAGVGFPLFAHEMQHRTDGTFTRAGCPDGERRAYDEQQRASDWIGRHDAMLAQFEDAYVASSCRFDFRSA